MNKSQALLLLLGAALLALLFWAFKPAPAVPPAAVAELAVAPGLPPPPAAAPALPAATSFRFEIRKGQRVAGPDLMQVAKGTRVVFELLTDHDDELHLHGYDKKLSLKAGVPASLSFEAEHSGRFELELHHGHLDLGALEVMP